LTVGSLLLGLIVELLNEAPPARLPPNIIYLIVEDQVLEMLVHHSEMLRERCDHAASAVVDEVGVRLCLQAN
jgi:hypothetical protein